MKDMKEYERYGIAVDQRYRPADGSGGFVIVRDVEKYADCGDVVVFNPATKKEYRIDAFKLAVCRYSLVTE